MDAVKAFLMKRIAITSNLSLETWIFFAVAIAVVLLVIAIISSSNNNKAIEKKKIDDAKLNNSIEEDTKKEIMTPEEASKQFFDVIDIPDEKSKTEPTVSVSKKEPIDKIVPLVKPQVVENKPIDLAVSEEKALIIEEEKSSDVVGKFTVVNSSLGGFRYLLLANNGQLLYESRDYKAKKTCIDAIPKFQNAVNTGTFNVKRDKFDCFNFTLKPQDNVNTLFIGESFKQNYSCLSNIESTKKFIDSPIVDRTSDEDKVSISSAYSIPKEIVDEVINNDGAKGIWTIDKVDDDEKSSPFVFLLYANNGQLLYESKEYKTKASCKSGLFTFIETVKDGVFIVDADKAGRFKFVLRSNKTGSQAEYIGQFYSTKQGCENSIDSVYKFALLSSTENLK
ncbi:MAG: hypothetical protein WCR54_00280 [Clostridia bacterium]